MAPRYSDDDLAEHLNNVFSESDNKIHISASSIKHPTMDFARSLIIAILQESDLNLDLKFANLPDELTGANELSITQELSSPIFLVAAARKFFNDLCIKSGENAPRFIFSLDDIMDPDPKRLKFFISHYINYWLFCNVHYDQFSDMMKQVSSYSDKKLEYEDFIKELKQSNEELRQTKASSAMKAEKLKGKIVHDSSKLAKLTGDVQAMTEKTEAVKGQTAKMKQDENDLNVKNKEIEASVLRLKTIARGDETKQELESVFESLGVQEHDILSQVSELKSKEESLTNQASNWESLMVNMVTVVDLYSKVKTVTKESKGVMDGCTTAHEKLETIEGHLKKLHCAIEGLKAEIAHAKAKWGSHKAMREKDLKEYVDKLSTMTKSLTEEDMVYEELDSQVSQAIMETEGLRNKLDEAKREVTETFQTILQSFKEYMEKMQGEHELLQKGWNNL